MSPGKDETRVCGYIYTYIYIYIYTPEICIFQEPKEQLKKQLRAVSLTL